MENEISYTKEDVKETPDVCEAIIVSIEESTAGQVFGEASKNKERKVFIANYENAEWKIKNHEVFSYFDKSFVPDRSKLGKFISKFGSFKVGTKFKILKTKDGFYKVHLD